MAELKDRNYISIQAFMVKDLGLKGNELITYALIYGFSQDGENYFRGSLAYIAEWLNCSKNTAHNVVKSLVDKGFLDKKEKEINKVKFCEYMAVVPNEKEENKDLDGRTKFLDTHTNNCDGGVQKTCTNNIKNNILDINSKANSFFTKKSERQKKNLNSLQIEQVELKQRIENVLEYLREEVFTDEQAENVKSCMMYFVDEYLKVFRRKHPVLSETVISDVAAKITNYTYVEHEKFTTCFEPLVSGYNKDTSYEEIIDIYFNTEFKKDIDYSVVHFSQKNVLTKLMGGATERTWFTNE